MRIIREDALEGLMTLPDKCCDTCITSPPYYGLRDYDAPGQIGLEPNPKEYIEKLVNVFREVRRVLKDDGTLWIVIGDSYATSSGNQPPANTRNSCGHTAKKRPDGYKLKDLMGIPWMLALALREDGWYLRQDIIWHKPNCMPESVRDRCTKSHEYIFLLSKQKRRIERRPGSMFRKKRDYIEEVRTNPNIYCMNECCETGCEKHILKTDKTKPYLLAYMKDTPYCIDEDPEMYKEDTKL